MPTAEELLMMGERVSTRVATGIHSHPTLKLGRRPDDYSKPKLDLTHLAATGDFSMVPARADYLSSFNGWWKMLGNGPDDRVAPGFTGAGDCNAVRYFNTRLMLTGSYPGTPDKTLYDMLWELYKTQNPDFDPLGDPNVNGPGSNADGGMATDELLDYLHKNGGPDGGRVVAYGTIDPTNIQAVERAIALFGFVWVDILVQAGNMEEFNQGKSWTNTGETPEGGHAVLGGGYDPRRKFETWTQEATFSDSFWTGRVGGDPLVSRVYVVIFEEHATKQFINSVSGQTLAEDYTALTGKSIVWPGQPTPSPSGDPDSVLAAAAKEFLQHHHTGAPLAMAKSLRAWLTAKNL